MPDGHRRLRASLDSARRDDNIRPRAMDISVMLRARARCSRVMPRADAADAIVGARYALIFCWLRGELRARYCCY